MAAYYERGMPVCLFLVLYKYWYLDLKWMWQPETGRKQEVSLFGLKLRKQGLKFMANFSKEIKNIKTEDLNT